MDVPLITVDARMTLLELPAGNVTSEKSENFAIFARKIINVTYPKGTGRLLCIVKFPYPKLLQSEFPQNDITFLKNNRHKSFKAGNIASSQISARK